MSRYDRVQLAPKKVVVTFVMADDVELEMTYGEAAEVTVATNMRARHEALDRSWLGPTVSYVDPIMTLTLDHIKKTLPDDNWMVFRKKEPKEGKKMKKAEILDALEAKPTPELADLAGVGLKRGRPSAALRQGLIDEITVAIAEKRVAVRKDGTFVRKIG